MLIKLDCRETKLFQLCTALNDEVKPHTLISESLPLGDAIIYDAAGKEKIIIERKSLNDLASSIRDGRYTEQGYRLNQCDIHNHHIYYVVEGDLRYYRPFKGMPDKKSLLSAMVSISYFKGFSLYRTNTLEETAEWILHFATKLQKEGTTTLPYYHKKGSSPDECIKAAAAEDKDKEIVKDATEDASAADAGAGAGAGAHAGAAYIEAMAKRTKKENITPDNIGEIMLSQIPNVSCASAMAIMRKFRTMYALMDAMRQDATALNDITVSNKNGQAKKLTKPCINNIYHYLLKPTTITVET
jgi:ERCC4-type nuclease